MLELSTDTAIRGKQIQSSDPQGANLVMNDSPEHDGRIRTRTLLCDGRGEDVSFMPLRKKCTHLRLVTLCKAVQREMLACLWASYLRVEPGKSCCSHSRFQWSELLSAAAWAPADVLFSKAPDQALLSPSAGYKDYFSCSPFSFPPPFISSFLLQLVARGFCLVWFSLQCQAPPGQPQNCQEGGDAAGLL